MSICTIIYFLNQDQKDCILNIALLALSI